MYFVYIMTNPTKTLYVGVTNNLPRRVRQHKTSIASGFSAKYKLNRLVYFEHFRNVDNAIEREKRIKGWLRIRKTALINSINPGWRDLSERWSERHQYQPQSMAPEPTRLVILSPASSSAAESHTRRTSAPCRQTSGHDGPPPRPRNAGASGVKIRPDEIQRINEAELRQTRIRRIRRVIQSFLPQPHCDI